MAQKMLLVQNLNSREAQCSQVSSSYSCRDKPVKGQVAIRGGFDPCGTIHKGILLAISVEPVQETFTVGWPLMLTGVPQIFSWFRHLDILGFFLRYFGNRKVCLLLFFYLHEATLGQRRKRKIVTRLRPVTIFECSNLAQKECKGECLKACAEYLFCIAKLQQPAFTHLE